MAWSSGILTVVGLTGAVVEQALSATTQAAPVSNR